MSRLIEATLIGSDWVGHTKFEVIDGTEFMVIASSD